MAVNAVQENNNSSPLMNIMKGSVLGAGGGYVLKYALPLNSSEKNDSYYETLKIIRKESKCAKKKVLEKLINIPVAERSPAQDIFVRAAQKSKTSSLYDRLRKIFGKKETSMSEELLQTRINKQITKSVKSFAEANGALEAHEFEKEIRNELINKIQPEFQNASRKLYKQYKKVWDGGIKHIRPNGLFIGLGVLTGFITAFIYNVITMQDDAYSNTDANNETADEIMAEFGDIE